MTITIIIVIIIAMMIIMIKIMLIIVVVIIIIIINGPFQSGDFSTGSTTGLPLCLWAISGQILLYFKFFQLQQQMRQLTELETC